MSEQRIQEIKEAAAYVCDKFSLYDLEHNDYDRAELKRDVDRLRRVCWPELAGKETDAERDERYTRSMFGWLLSGWERHE